MANFSANQVRQLYVVKACKTSNAGVQSDFANECDVQVKKTNENELYFLYKGSDGIMKSDFIPLDSITYAKTLDAADLATKMRKISLSLPSSINSGDAVIGQNYVLNINFKNFFSSGDDSQYYKTVAVHITSANTDDSDFYKSMVSALNKAFAREDGATATSNPYLKFKIGYSTSSESEEGDANWASASATKIIIEEKPQDWVLGTKEARRIYFDVFPEYINDGSDDVIWAKQEATGYYFKEETPTTTVGNGQKIADLEWWCLGERGDQYRYMGYPNYIPSKYYVESNKEYHVIEFHYSFTDTGVNSYKTEKELTIVVPKGESTANYTEVNKVVAAVNYYKANLLNTLS